MSFSTAYEPPAGSVTAATWDSSISSEEVLRAIRRPNASGRPERARRTARTVTASAPPTPAAKAATVPRSMFTHGSYLLIIGAAGDGVLALAGARRAAPDASSTRAQSRRAARSLAIVGNCSSVAA